MDRLQRIPMIERRTTDVVPHGVTEGTRDVPEDVRFVVGGERLEVGGEGGGEAVVGFAAAVIIHE